MEPLEGRRFVRPAELARRINRSEATARNYVGRGLVTGYRLPGRRGLFVDLDEALAAIAALPRGRTKGPYARYGPDAKIVDLRRPSMPEVVE